MPLPETDPIVVAPIITPFDAGDRVDHDPIGRNVARWLATPLGGFLIGSATGEEWFLSEPEKLAIVRTPMPAGEVARLEAEMRAAGLLGG